jgi:hypothetical protein
MRSVCCILLACMAAEPALASSWSEPHPWRRDALLQGRDYEYDARSFLQRLSYRPLYEVAPDQDGIFGSAGSVSSRELYMDSDVRKTLRFDDGYQDIRLRYRRSEDFDGYFDRQIIGYGVEIDGIRAAVAGDVRADKAETDVYFELAWRPNTDTFFRANVILPDAYFNQKASEDARYVGRAHTWFGEWRQRVSALRWHLVVNTSPTVTVLDNTADVRASGDQHRASLSLVGGERWQWRLSGEAERSDRNFLFDPNGAAEETAFARRMHSVTTSVTATQWPLSPSLGVYHFSMTETGWLGLAQQLTVNNRHDEPYGFVTVQQALTERWQWHPAVYVGRVSLRQSYEEAPERDNEKRRWQGKLSLPLSYNTSAEQGAYLTISPSFYLHKPAFGGGNVQLHWPF